MKRIFGLRWALFLGVFAADRLVKEFLRFWVPPNDPASSVNLVNGVLYLHRAEGPFGMLALLRGVDPLLQRISVVVAAAAFLVFLILWIRSTPDSQGGEIHALVLILSGVASNAVDWAVFGASMKTFTWQVGVLRSFSLADLAVFSGLCLLVLLRLKRRRLEKMRAAGSREGLGGGLTS